MPQLPEFVLMAFLVMEVVYDRLSVVFHLYNMYHVNSQNCLVLLHTVSHECLFLLIVLILDQNVYLTPSQS